ncbi:ABC transporter ATP-binding protein [Stackebrandtia soli]|uniref:ABC transporter ATP-binding protein n=1 Tax=Stackebrandtia soli TaxID=1892856 RepID=UPI0039ECAABD
MSVTIEESSRALPVADPPTVRRHLLTLARTRKRMLFATIAWFFGATACGLAVPALLGYLVEDVARGSTAPRVDLVVAAVAVFLLVQGLLTRMARLAAARLGEHTLADLREEFVDRVLAVPIATVETAGTGDLLSRSSRDVNMLSRAIRMGVPSIATAVLTVVLTAVALVVVSPLLALASLIAVPLLGLSTRWYLRRARPAYLNEGASYSDLTDGLSETVHGARTVDALSLQQRRVRRTDTDIARSYRAERGTLRLRTVWFPMVDVGYILPVVGTLLVGGIAYANDWVGLGEVTAAVLYTRALVDPLDELLSWLDELQVGGAALSRILGVGQVSEAPSSETATPNGSRVRVDGVRFSYRSDREVLRGIDLDVAPGERIAIVGASGAGKSTLGRIVAGVHPATAGRVTVGDVDLAAIAPHHRRNVVALVTQEHHVFAGSIADNVALADPNASPERVAAALAAVDAADWVEALPDGVSTVVGSGGLSLSPARSQQVALARLALSDPQILVLDEATSMIDASVARHLERSLATVMRGRTVLAIAHRLHTASDADRVAVMADGEIVELGTHDELLAADGTYASLWRSWHGTAADAADGDGE